MKTIVMMLGISLWGKSLCFAQVQEIVQVVERLQDRLNSRAVSSVVGGLDYEFVYAVSAEQEQVVLLEKPPALQVSLPDSAEIKQRLAAVPDSLGDLEQYFSNMGPGTTLQDSLDLRWPVEPKKSLEDVEQYLLDAVQVKAIKDSLVALGFQEERGPVIPAAGGSAGTTAEVVSMPADEPVAPPASQPFTRPARAPLTAASLPADLKQADVGMLKSRLRSPQGTAGDPLYLGVRPAAEDLRFPGERLTLAENELSMADRRQMNWEVREVFDQWPAGTVLVLETTAPEKPAGDAAEMLVRWSFRRPGPPPFDQPEILASGELTLSMRKVGEEWKVSHIEKLIGALHANVVK